MPNHCANILRVKGDKEDLASFVAFAAGLGPAWDGAADDEKAELQLDLNKFVPVPESILNAKKNNSADAYNSGGYEWVIANWGTKWGCYEVEVSRPADDTVQYRYQTAWAPFRNEMLMAMSEKFPALKFEMKFAEAGCGFCGIVTAEGGDIVEDNYYENKAFNRKLKADEELSALAECSG